MVLVTPLDNGFLVCSVIYGKMCFTDTAVIRLPKAQRVHIGVSYI